MSDDTEILEKKPWLKAALDYSLKRLEIVIIAGIIGGCNHLQHVKLADKQDQDAKWVGEHLEQKQQQIDELKGNH
jgi:hypothetical protein